MIQTAAVWLKFLFTRFTRMTTEKNVWGRHSLIVYQQIHPDLQRLFDKVLQIQDISLVSGYRDKDEQNRLYEEGYSKLQFPRSHHNKLPSLAVDVQPYPLEDPNDPEPFKDLAVVVKEVAEEEEVDVTWGGDWISFKDYYHWQLG